MFVTSVSLVCFLSLVSGNVLYFKPHHQQNEVVSEFDQAPEERPDIIVYDPVIGHESRVPTKIESPVAERPFRSVMCPGGKSECPDNNTCCKLSNGRYGCCPYPDAICCSDMRHCCPSGYTCDLVGGHCKKGHLSIPLSSKLSASKHIKDVNKVKGSSWLVEGSMIDGPLEICSGGEQACRSGYSCCSNANGTYSCCGYSPAHCCADKEHCCPANYKCLSDGRCEDKNGLTLPRSLKIETTSIKVKANVTCRDKSQCTVGNTCCLKGTNDYGCCPLPNAVCCSDKKHCCPYGYACGPTVGYCKKGYHIIDLSKGNNLDLSNDLDLSNKLPADPKDTDVVSMEVNAVSNVVCPDKQSSCPNGQTCCKQNSGKYGCCPAPNAVCCSDKIHCCPQDTTCDVSQGKCLRRDYSIDWFEKSPSFSMSKPTGVSGNHICPDHQTFCYVGTTCCKVSGRVAKYKCCPHPKAVCCGDDHCCPEGTTCDPQSKSCIKQGSDQVTEWLTNVKALTVQNVVCPDGRSECPTGNTCCLGEGNMYGCCPQPNAVCCEDKKHCCPENTKCDPTNHKCLRSNGLLSDWFEKTKSMTVVSSSVICPDGQSQCPEGNTCCALSGGSYGCCPRPNAVCCSDKKHCCPQGYTCNTGSAQCTKNNGLTISWFEKTESQPMSTNVICPDGKSECPSGSTCCDIGGGKYGCCPKPNAVCCDDEKHCCPNGYTCSTGTGKCTKSNGLTIDWFTKTESRPVSSDVVCPDGKSECKSGTTCCKLGDNRYGCCPLPNAVCCDDEKHCCPNGYTCSTGTGKCTKSNGLTIDWVAKTESRPVSSDVVCPDGKSECKSGTTCCKLGDDRYGCCPLPNAVCCDDEKHCCPNGYTCSTGTGKCTKSNGLTIDWFAKTESRPVSSDVVCPDGKSECKSGTTCCKLGDNRYGCCPLPNAVCCDDEKHCCPNGYTCSTGTGKCTKSNGLTIDWFAKTESRPVSSDVVCPDGKSECKSGTTCCKLGDNRYGCCPLPNAVCCDDEKHCCPNGYTCSTGTGKCTKSNGLTIDWFAKTESRPVSSDVVCPDGKSECKSGTTCCKLGDNRYGCCPLPNAVCCDDEKHCCPNGYTCSTGTGKCTKSNGLTIDWFAKTESRPVSSDVVCPDGKSECKSGTTCCKLGDNRYGCCPLPNAVCCDDEKHCCPNGYTCSTGTGKCTKSNGLTIDWFAKTESRPVSSDVVCPDGKSECKSGTTCCKLGDNRYGCCPLPNAVCCDDEKHCCPNGYTCSTGTGKCTKSNGLTIDWFAKTESRPVSSDVVCPDGKSECKSGTTCCKLGDNRYGCCPLPNAVCCDDEKHCCPNGYTCSTGTGKCTKSNGLTIDWVAKTESRPVSSDVVCPDGKSECKSGTTCCKLGDDRYGCCPLPNAVCCDDEKHCCPNGYTCSTGTGKCTKSNGLTIDWFAKTESRPVSSDVVCPDGKSECKSGTTCCKLGDNRYGCCPLPNAVCCDDEKHCCPNGYTCSTGTGKCTKSNGFDHRLGLKTESRPVSSDVVCPDGKSECKSGTTCCKLGDDRYGCCPLPNAVCCDDEKHCCPNGYTCSTGTGKCTKSNGLTIDWFAKTESRPVSSDLVVCPDGKSECKSGTTCCKLGDNRYGCCPLPNAVCCDDEKHCCPNGYTCSTGTGKCTKSNGLTIDWVAKTESRPVSSDVVCPDGKSECKSGTTCCKLGDDRYGCCPLPNAVCCDDEKHCCPNGYTCSTGTGKCTKSNGLTIDWVAKTESRPVSSDVVCPDGKSECKSGTTCCKLGDDRYGCCPLPNAVCCDDEKHCCPNGYTCSTGTGKCTKSNGLTIDWFAKTESRPVSSDVVCPDGKSECKSGTTCCKLGDNRYGCCPLPNAVCCDDEKHCCPNGYTCSTGTGKCTKSNGLTIDWVAKTESRPVSSDVVCPDGKSECKSGPTCCKLGDDRYGCCPLPNAVCCDDRKHCCPNGYTCSTGTGKCTKSNGLTIDWFAKTESRPVSSDVVCPDGKSECKSGTTCCKLGDDRYGCCPLPMYAVCCDDEKHCCPNGYTCSTGTGKCTKSNGLTIDWVAKTESLPVSSDVVCPDGKSECKSGTTCCKLGDDRYGCCPLPNAVCCDDEKHCCPNGYTCSTGTGKCTKSNGLTIDWFAKTESRPVSSDVVCPDGKSECKSGTTCCKLGDDRYGCCPLPNAVCCDDEKHCCPNGYTCSTGTGKCTKSNGLTIDWFAKTESRPVSSDVVCPDGKSECKSGTTCCKLGDDRYGCCPLPNAVCCDDEKHCCPNGYTCSTGTGKCTKSNGLTIDWFAKTESRPVSSDVVCPDGKSECKSGTTCCKLGDDRYGCCPLPNAVCCDDEKHCCPNGYTCSTGTGKCTKSNGLTIDWFAKTESRPVSSDVVCPDGKSECKSGTTCCKLSDGRYGCCPRPNAVCCNDGQHCCPQNTECDLAHGTCRSSHGFSQNWLEKTESFPVVLVTDIVCPDEKSQCPPGNTCCLVGANTYGCCPRPNAVCCADMKHCCPEHTTCSTSNGTCISTNGVSMEWLDKSPSISVPQHSGVIAPASYNDEQATSVVCPDGGSCLDGQTCCNVTAEKYGCCAYPNAVCCPDGLYCCPKEYICDGNMICRDPNDVKRKDSSTNLLLQRLARKVRDRN
ncbi:LOW QUALITY PROTEIN: extracellular matrix protein A-like [Argopecten irradians]|uniref:LOW QUALITY PROTEIN: extracellular matrix protein A-like n=1 Tax=Argopecten irradians TaxID=31199 RepID=UPI00370FF20C